jgi:AcrR family transcriptional regulator
MQEAFLRLIESKPFDEISIKEITDGAGLSYPTFFRRYANKGELLDEIATVEVRALLSIGHPALDRKGQVDAAALCTYVHAHRGLWAVLLNGGAAHVMREEFKRIAEEQSRQRPRANPWLPTELAVPFVTSGIFEILAWWLRQPDDYPLEDVVILFNALIVDVTAKPRNVPVLSRQRPDAQA